MLRYGCRNPYVRLSAMEAEHRPRPSLKTSLFHSLSFLTVPIRSNQLTMFNKRLRELFVMDVLGTNGTNKNNWSREAMIT
jgi:hypothetical protein